MKSYVLNMVSEPERRHHVLEQLSSVNADIVLLTEEFYSGECYPGLNHGETGCTKSHEKICELAKESNCDFVMVFEDDMKVVGDLNKIIENIEDIFNKTQFDVLMLGYCAYDVLGNQIKYGPTYKHTNVADHSLFKLYEYQNYVGTFSFIMSRKGIDKMFDIRSKHKVAADSWHYFARVEGLNIIHIYPTICDEDKSFESSIKIHSKQLV